MSKLVIIEKERNLLLESEVLKPYPGLINALSNDVPITEDYVYALPDDQKSTLLNLKDSFIKQATKEWFGDKEAFEVKGSDRKTWLNCSLCGELIKKIWYIHNTISGKYIHVGSECVQKFWDDEFHKGISINQVIRDAQQLRRLNLLNKKIPGIKKIIESWRQFPDLQPIIIHNKLESRYIECGKNMEKVYKDFLGRKDDDVDIDATSISNLREYLKAYEILCKEIETYVAKNIEHAPTRAVANWLVKNNRQYVLQMLKTDGMVTQKTAFLIEEPHFLDSLVVPINNALNSYGVMIERTNLLDPEWSKAGYIARVNSASDIILMFEHNKLLKNIGHLFLGGSGKKPSEIKPRDIIDIACVYNNASFEIVLDSLTDIANRINLKIEGYNLEVDEILIDYPDKNKRLHFLAEAKAFANKLKHLAYGLGDINDISKYIKTSSGKRYTKEELRTYNIASWRHRKK